MLAFLTRAIGVSTRKYSPLIDDAPPVYRTGRRIAFAISRWFFRCQWHGIENIPLTGPLIVAPNHTCFFDPFLCAAVVPRRMYFLALKPFFEVPVIGKWMTKAGGYPVDPDEGGAGSAREVLTLLKGGAALGMFPEGTRSYDGHLLEAKAGVGLLVAGSAAAVVPVKITGAFEAWSRHHRIPRPYQVTVTFGPPVELDALRAKLKTDRSTRRATQQQIADSVMSAIAAL
jgi:1-acyl-sn-glycerol-3-phosphate acyltransferase